MKNEKCVCCSIVTFNVLLPHFLNNIYVLGLVWGHTLLLSSLGGNIGKIVLVIVHSTYTHLPYDYLY